MYKVFIQDRPIFFITEGEISNYDGILIPQVLGEKHNAYIRNLVQELPQEISIYILCSDPEAAISTFFEGFELIEAAGGIVRRKNKYLFIKRFGKWDLPKGKMDEGETPEITAQREIEEECGIAGPELKDLLLITYHTYAYQGRPTLKKTYWYAMTYDGPKDVKPQEEEGITKVSWKSKDKIGKVLDNTYGNITDVLNAYFG